MDRITKSLLDEFSKEHDLLSLGEDKRFEHLAVYLTVSRHYGETFNTGESVTGSGGDTGIDGLTIIVNGSIATEPEDVEELSQTNGYLDVSFVFVQAERSAAFEMAKIGQFGFGVLDFFKDHPALPQNSAIQRRTRGNGKRLRAKQPLQTRKARLPFILRDYRQVGRRPEPRDPDGGGCDGPSQPQHFQGRGLHAGRR